MSKDIIQNGKFVALTYSISDSENRLLGQDDILVNYIHGGGQALIGSMESELTGKGVGDEVEMTLSPDEAFGPHHPELTFTDDLKNVPPAFRSVGAEIQMEDESGDPQIFYVTSIEGDKLTVDGNHPLAGKSVIVHITIHEVRDPNQDDHDALTTGGAAT